MRQVSPSAFKKREPSSANKVSRDSPNWAALLSALSMLPPIGYMIGYYFDGGYLHGYGVAQDMFPRSFQDYIVESFSAFFYLFVHATKLLDYENYKKWLLVCVAATFYALFILGYLKGAEWLSRKYSPVNRVAQKLKEKTTAILVFSWLAMLLAPAVLVYVPLFLVLPAYVADSLGNQAASKEIREYKGCTETSGRYFEQCVSVFESGKLIVEGILVASSEKFIAIFTGKSTLVFPLKTDTTIVRNVRATTAQLPKS